MSHSHGYIIGFAAGICIFCSIFVSGSAVALKERQDQNRILDRQKNVISVSGLVDDMSTASGEDIQQMFSENIRPMLINLETGEAHDGSIDVSCDDGSTVTIEAATYDQQKALRDPCLSESAPPNNAKLLTVPLYESVEVNASTGCAGWVAVDTVYVLDVHAEHKRPFKQFRVSATSVCPAVTATDIGSDNPVSVTPSRTRRI